MTSRAVIVRATGLIGRNLAEHLVSKGWEVYGLARKPQRGIPGVRAVAADLLEPEALRSSLAGLDPTDLGKLASAWHTDLDLGREIEVVTDMTKSRLAGFNEY